MQKTFILILAIAFTAAASAQEYKWVDKDGRVVYGDTPPPGVQATPLKRAATPPSPSPAAKKDGKGPSPEAAFRKRQEDAQRERDKQTQAEQEAQATRENCTRAQDALRTLESGQRIARTDAKGERYYLEDAQIAQERERAQRDVKQWCG
jgi:hypothetical protein